MILRVYRRYRDPGTDGYSSIREQTTDYVVQSYEHCAEVQDTVRAQAQAPLAGYNFALFTE